MKHCLKMLFSLRLIASSFMVFTYRLAVNFLWMGFAKEKHNFFLFFFFYGGELRGTQWPPKMHFPASQSPANRPQPLGDTAVEKHNFNRILKSSCCILLGQFLSLLFQNNYTILTPSSSLVEQFRQTFVTMCSNSLILTFCVATI